MELFLRRRKYAAFSTSTHAVLRFRCRLGTYRPL